MRAAGTSPTLRILVMQTVSSAVRGLRASLLSSTAVSAQPAPARAALDTFAKGGAKSTAVPLAPPSFEVNGKKVVFADIQKVDSAIVLDVAAKKSTVKAVVELEISEKGQPAIELVPRATKVVVDGKEIDAASYANVRDPANKSSFRVIGMDLEPGKHRVEIEYELTGGVRFCGDSVEFFGRKSDLDDRSMDEQYFPTNLEYDQYPGSLTFEVTGTSVKHRVMTNGDVSEQGSKLVVTYPAHYNTASLYLNVINPEKFAITEGVYEGIAGKIPVTVYTPNGANFAKEPASIGGAVGLKPRAPEVKPGDKPMSAIEAANRAMDVSKRALAQHEKDFGAYPHPRLLVRISGSGGMEYSGATESDIGSLAHELHHQWFARSAQPANGNAGWIDEAAASWHDKGYPTSSSAPFSPRKLSGFPAWHRITPTAAYSHGANCMAYLDSVFQPKGGLRPVLASFFAAYKEKVFTTENFIAHLKQEGAGLSFDFDAFFAKQVYGTGLAASKKI